ncbi:hypothetical protein HCH_02318 [Hahella chejuensis KCTC 2396]|uniref:Uncharacterized protein n=1 Tax=Hahella chejuensis (strain KCTC 2396) TaxID=349521 RepID=Q2SJN3_HAHCH|nr:hypothetical protein HCH_02318 [Hahella chejuensis KCTC 2396]
MGMSRRLFEEEGIITRVFDEPEKTETGPALRRPGRFQD